MSSRKHRGIISSFEHTCSTSPPSPLWKIFTKIDQRLLGAATPTTSSLKNSWTRKSLTYSRKNNTREPASSPRPQPLQLLEYKWWNTC